MRILRHPVPTRLDREFDPAAVFRSLYASEPNVFWLDGGPDATTGRSFLGAGTDVAAGTSVLDLIAADPVLPSADEPFPLGRVGWLGYGLARATAGVPVALGSSSGDPSDTASPETGHQGDTPSASALSAGAMMRVDRLIAVDHATGEVELIASGENWSGELGRWRDEALRALASVDVPDAPALVPLGTDHPAVWADTDSEYLEKIAACQRAIRDGDVYQLCLTTEAAVTVHPDPLDCYLALRASSPSHHGGLVRISGTSLLSASPEQFLTVAAGVVETRPIKGTRPRGRTDEEDRHLADELLADPKERAENLMIVDLMRNDLGRVCEIGSVSVPTLFAVKSYAHVHQLVSTVRGVLAAGRHPLDVIRSCFPAGSMTGAPKLRAMELLDAFERRPRGLYSGAFGWIGADGSVSLAMVIRSIVLSPAGATIGAGGGITSSSVPERELAEVKLKATALLEVLGAT